MLSGKKAMLLPLLLVIMLLVMAGCSGSNGSGNAENGGAESGGNRPGSSSGTVDLSVAINAESSDSKEQEIWDQILASYKEIRPDVNINFQLNSFGGVEQHRTWVTTQLIGGTAPDIFETRYIWDQEDLKKDLIYDLTSYFSESFEHLEDQTWEDIYPESVLKQLIGTDKTYASVPTSISIVRILYNKSLFEEAGIMEAPITWNEFMEAQEKLQGIGVVPFGFPNTKPGDYNYNWSTRILTEELIAGSYPEMDVDESGFIEINEYVRAVDQGTIDIEQSPYRDVFPLIKDWSQYWPEGYNGIDFDTSNEMFLRGEVAMVMRTSSQAKVLFESGAKDFEIAVFPLPYLTEDNHPAALGELLEIGGVPAGNLAIPKSTSEDKMDAALDFIAYITSPEIQGLLAEQLYRTPATSNAELSENLQGFKLAGDKMQLNIYGGEVDKNVTEYNQKLGQLYLEGSISVDELLSQLKQVMVDGVNQKMEENNWNEGNNYGINP